MADAPLVVTRADDSTPSLGNLFAGASFFLVQRLPQRANLISLIQANGGRIVKLENQADYMIADHLRQDCPTASLSYTFVEAAIRDGVLPDPDDHRAGPKDHVAREVGSRAIPAKVHRTPFTDEDDRVLWVWVQKAELKGGKVKGNEIYKQLEAINKRHTFQAWRDRYIKRMIDKPPPDGAETMLREQYEAGGEMPEDNVEEMNQSNDNASKSTAPARRRKTKSKTLREVLAGQEFTQDDWDRLMGEGHHIVLLDKARMDEAWEAWAEDDPSHTAEEWRTYWENEVLPVFLEEQGYDEGTAQREDPNGNNSFAQEQNGVEEPQSRKRTATTPLTKSSGRKRKKTDYAESSRGQSPELDDENSYIYAPPGAQILNSHEAEQELPTSEMNQAAKEQLEAEVNRLGDGADAAAELNGGHISELETSDAIQQADNQLSRESAERDNESQIDEEPRAGEDMPRPEPPAVEAETNRFELDPALQLPGQQSAVSEGTPLQSNALTKENLGKHRDQLKPQPVRGVDLPEDEETVDQTAYLRFLEDVTGQKSEQQLAKTNAEAQRTAGTEGVNGGKNIHVPDRLMDTPEEEAEDAIELECDRALSPDSEDSNPAPYVPQQESQNLSGFETQDPYPEFDSQFPAQAGEGLSEQPFVLQEFANSELAPGMPAHDQPEFDFELPAIENYNDLQAHEGLDFGNEINLNVPESEGFGFKYPSSAPGGGGTDAKPSIEQGNQAGAINASESAAPRQAEVMDISSGSSSTSSSDLSEGNEMEDGEPTQQNGHQRQNNVNALDTQAVLDTETQELDLSLPLPPDSDEEQEDADSLPDNPLQHPFQSQSGTSIYNDTTAHQQPQSTTRTPRSRPTKNARQITSSTDPLTPDQIEPFIEQLIAQHFPEAMIIDALEMTSMRPTLTELVCISLQQGKRVPDDVPGVWTPEDDYKLQYSTNAREHRELEARKGTAEYNFRRDYLNKRDAE